MLFWTYLCTCLWMLIILQITFLPSKWKDISDIAKKNCPPKIMYPFTFPPELYKECPIHHTLAKTITINLNFCCLIGGENLIPLLMWMSFCFVCFGGRVYISLRIIKLFSNLFVHINIESRGYHLHEIHWLLQERNMRIIKNYIADTFECLLCQTLWKVPNYIILLSSHNSIEGINMPFQQEEIEAR